MTLVYQLRSLVRRGGAGRHRVRSDTGRRPQYKQRLLGGRVALNYARPWTVPEAVLRAGMVELRLACEAGHIEICDQHGRRLDHAVLFGPEPPGASEGGAAPEPERSLAKSEEPDARDGDERDERDKLDLVVAEPEAAEAAEAAEPEAPEPEEALDADADADALREADAADAAEDESPTGAGPARAQRRKKRAK